MTKKAAYHFEAILNTFFRGSSGVWVKLTLDPQDIPEELALANRGQRFMVALSEIGDYDSPDGDKGDGDRAVQLAGILCRTPEFWQWLRGVQHQRGMLPSAVDEKTATEALKTLTKVGSRADYRTDDKARDRFRKLQSHYQEWLERSESKGEL